MKKIIWSLFDSETATTKNLAGDKYDVFTIGLPSESSFTNNFLKIDLSKKRCLVKLRKLPPPNIIFASPPCETWVTLSAGNVRFFRRNNNEYNLYWQKNLKPNDFTRELRRRRLIGQRTAYFTAEIIKRYNPELWVVENGITSLIFRYLHQFHGMRGYKNKARYSAYCSADFSEKPTIFFSNKKISLRKEKIKSNKRISENSRINKSNTPGFKHIATYADRSRVPIGIYKDILDFYEGKGQRAFDF